MPFVIQGDKRCPKIHADFNQGVIEISGISLPENPYSYYLPFHEALTEYLQNPKEQTLLILKLEYFNTGSALALRNTIDQLGKKLSKDELLIKWYYETDDIDMMDSGEEFESIFPKVKFELIEVEEF